MEYKGWIPTVTGRLSFDFFGDSDFPDDAISQNVSDSKIRYTIIYQKRNLSDATLPCKNQAAKWFFDFQSTFWCVCLGCSMQHEQLSSSDIEPPFSGRLFLFHNKITWKESTLRSIKKAQQKLDSFSSFDAIEQTDLKEFFRSDYDALCKDLTNSASFCADYNLTRNGILTLSINETLTQAPHCPKFPSEPTKRKHLYHIVCSQLYFFLRDIGHRHQHHHPSTDTIIDLYPSDISA